MVIQLVDYSTVSLVQTNATDEMVAHAAWVSNFGSEAGTKDASNPEKLINFLYENKHMSPFEHGSFTWFIDTPIFVAREFMRHRTFSYNETSGRYKELEPRFYMAPSDRPAVQTGKIGSYTFELADTPILYELIRENTKKPYEEAWKGYQNMLQGGVAKEVARNVLPLGTMTQFYATANPRNVMQFLTLRNDKHALKEIRDVAIKIEEDFKATMPLTWAVYDRMRAGSND